MNFQRSLSVNGVSPITTTSYSNDKRKEASDKFQTANVPQRSIVMRWRDKITEKIAGVRHWHGYRYESLCRDEKIVFEDSADNSRHYRYAHHYVCGRWGLTICMYILMIIVTFFVVYGLYIMTGNANVNAGDAQISESTKEMILTTLKSITPNRTQDTHRQFVRPPLTEKLECGRLFSADEDDYIKQMTSKRIIFEDPEEHFPLDCEAIRARNYYPDEPASAAEAAYPLAEARVVHQDYLLMEMELAAGYAPQNWYCFAIDKKASAQFHRRMRALAKCLPNIFLTSTEYNVDRGGHNMTSSYVECLKELLSASKQWKYVSLLQSHDISLKTNAEMVQIFQWLNGANDVETAQGLLRRYDPTMDWSFKALHLFRNDSRNELYTKAGYPPTLAISKGFAESSLTREMVDFLLNTLDLSELLRRIESFGYGTDETMIPTLNAADAVEAPGGFTTVCADAGIIVQHLTRYSVWTTNNNCATGFLRHNLCIFGIEDLRRRLEDLPHFFVNKLMPHFDFGAIACWYERLFNRTINDTPSSIVKRLNQNYYARLPHVRFQEVKADAARRGVTVDLKNFACKL